MQNSFLESFNGQMWDELLNETLFGNLAHARVVIAAWANDYNTERRTRRWAMKRQGL